MKRIIQSMLLCVLLVLASAYMVQAQDIVPDFDWDNSLIVKQDGTGDFTEGPFAGIKTFPTIKEALGSGRIGDGSQIVVFPGTYVEDHLALSNVTGIQTLRTYAGPGSTILSTDSRSSYLFANSTYYNPEYIIGFTIRNSNLNVLDAHVSNCIFEDAPTIELGSSYSPKFTNNIFHSYNDSVFEIDLGGSSGSLYTNFIGGVTAEVKSSASLSSGLIQNNIFFNNHVPPIDIVLTEYSTSKTDIDGNRITVEYEVLTFIDGLDLTIMKNNCFFNNDVANIKITPENESDNLPDLVVYPRSMGINSDLSFSADSGNIEFDPQFVNSLTGDLRLLSSSPIRDKGASGAAFLDPDGSLNDIGAFGGRFAVGFFQSIVGAPIIRSIQIEPVSVLQGEPFTIRAVGAVN